MDSLVGKGSGGKGDGGHHEDSASESGSTSSNNNKDMQDFSMSSLISNLSKLADGNNSSFLMHVDSNPSSRRNSTSNSPQDFQDPAKVTPSSSSVLQKSNSDKDKKKDTEKKELTVSNVEENVKESSQRDSTATQSDFFLEDWMKGLKGAPLPIRRFPPPPLPSIFEQSGEGSLYLSSRASSVVSTTPSMKSVKKCKPPAQGPIVQENNHSKNIVLEAARMTHEADAEHGRQRVEHDSWDEFDRELDKSLLPKECDLQEFEKLATRNPNGSILPNDDKSFFGSAEGILERDEKERDQFCKSTNDSFSTHDSLATEDEGEGGILSITNYFKSRSSFPVTNVANESSRFLDDSVVIASPPEEQKYLDCNNEDLKITRNYSSLFGNDEQDTLTPATPGLESSSSPLPVKMSDDAVPKETPTIVKSYCLDKKTKQVANFLVGSESNGAGTSTIMDFVLDVCKRRSSIGTSESLSKYKSQREASSKSKSSSHVPAASPLIYKDLDAYLANNKSEKVHHYPLPNPPLCKVTLKDDSKMDSLAFKKPLAPKPPDSQKQASSEARILEFKTPKLNTTKQSTPRGLKRNPEPVIQDNEAPTNEKSFVVSEPGKVLHDDIDGFDKFKSNLNKPKTSHRPKLAHLSKENKSPRSAFAVPSFSKENIALAPSGIVNKKDSKATKVESSIERLRTGGCLSPPERPYDSTKSKMDASERDILASLKATTPTKDPAVRLDTNHSTPIAPESASKSFIQKFTAKDEQHVQKSQLGQDSLVSTVSTVSSVETVRRNKEVTPPSAPTHENATSTRNSSPVHAGKNEEVLQIHPIIKNGKDDECKKDSPNNDKKQEEDGILKTENGEFPSSCQTSRHLPEGHHGQHPSTYSSVPSAYSYMGMMPPSGGCNHGPQQFPISIHIHLPSFPMGIPPYQYGPHHNAENFNVGAAASSSIAPDFNPPCSNSCKCSHQPDSRTHR